MKIIILALITFPVVGQNYYTWNSNFDWTKYEHSGFTSEILTDIFPLIKDSPYQQISQAISNVDKFHFYDFNSDRLIDIIYDGWNGSEGSKVMFLKKTANGYLILQSFNGTVKHINSRSNEFELLDYACCAGYVDHVLTIRYNSLLEEYEIVKDHALIVGTTIPKYFMIPIKFKITNSPYNLRINPEIKSLKSGMLDFTPIKDENISASYQSGDTGTAIAEQMDGTGRIWWFVIMDSKPDPTTETLFYKGNNDYYDYKPVGWISSRYVEQM